MRSIMKKCLFVAFTVILLAVLVPHTSHAQTNYKSIKRNTWVNANSDHYYKFSIPNGVYIKLEFKATKGTSSRLMWSDTKKFDPNHANSYYFNEGVNYYVLPKGTYYINCDGKIRWSIKKYNDDANYCRSRAKKVTLGKKVPVVMGSEYTYNRWYKITLKKKKVITIVHGGYDIRVWNSKAQKCKLSSGYTKNKLCYVKTEQLDKGTYYIELSAFNALYMADNLGTGVYTEFTVK